jgi:protein-S-isoprenylcysteine O-methyltransferase Ste14
METSFKIGLFIIASAGMVRVSRVPLRSFRFHGFYRFFAWEALSILILLHLDVQHWIYRPSGLRQIIAESCLAVSLFLAIDGFLLLRKAGKPDDRRTDPALFWIEKTTVLVTVGAYKRIRHPLITSLLLLTWGVFLKAPSLLAASLAVIVTFNLVVASKVEERENREFFGAPYGDYMKRTKMFIPFVI